MHPVHLVTSDRSKITGRMACVLIVGQPHAFIHTPKGSYTGNFHMPGSHFSSILPTAYFLGQVVSLTADAQPLARGNLRTIIVDLLQPHPHYNTRGL
ncbi:hypothetical protein O181_083837 [Austropuccinia psidii MF-1]|uniref:Uncharacterized protein n=1 Tax=Austropuccinia psidii MF-1 TaxID=1389203 RepID=A0A9Q3IKG2_9BASI|nr:hypothetical protein [Austropuccinia psidii MF-1]